MPVTHVQISDKGFGDNFYLQITIWFYYKIVQIVTPKAIN